MEKYLDKCITSLIIEDSNLMELLDIIIVNDGSKDNSSNIAHGYSIQYPNTIRVIDKENGNYGSCINKGLHVAKGKYIKILDADDSFDNKNWIRFIKILCKVDADLVLSDYNLVNEKGQTVSTKKFKFNQNMRINADAMPRELGEVEMHAITYKTQILINMNYRQTEGISYTDTEWVFIPMQNITTLYYIPLTVYKYLVGRTGQTMDRNTYIKNREHIKKVLIRLINETYSNNLLHSPKKIFYQHRLYGYCIRFYNLSLMDNKFKSSELIEVDNYIKDKCPALFKFMSNISFSGIQYIYIWRKNNYKFPFFAKILLRMIQIKQKYLPTINLGWQKRINKK